jgi:heme-degrading monooxygenase HmoA
MILEQALFTVAPGSEPAFEADFERARGVVARSPGYRSLRLLRGIEQPSSYLLLIEWDSVQDHMQGFRESELFQQWGALTRPHLGAPPAVQHFDPVVSQ